MGNLSPGQGTSTDAAVQSVQQAAAMANNGVLFGVGTCLAFVRSVLGFATDPVTASDGAAPTAADAWNQVPQAERFGDANPPAGVPVYWLGGSQGDGHVALSAGNGQVYSTDFGPNGYVGDGRVHLTSIAIINGDSSLHYQGWSPYLGDTSASNGNYSGGGVTTPQTTTSTSGPSLSLGGIAGTLLSPFSALFSAAGKGLARVGYGIVGLIVVLAALKMLGGGNG